MQEDELLCGLVAEHGAKEWTALAQRMEALGHCRLGKQCRERFVRHVLRDRLFCDAL